MTLYYAPSQNFVQKTLDAALDAGVTASATLNNVTGIQNKKGVFIVDRVNSAGVETPLLREVIAFTGTSGSTLTTLTRNVDGANGDRDHAIGAIVEFAPDVIWADGVMDALDNLVDSTGAVDNTKIPVLSGDDATTLTTTAATNVTLPTTGTLATLAGTEAISNKAITASSLAPRTNTVASSATPTINTDTTDIFTITALATAITSMTTNLSGTPVNGQKLIVRIKDDGTARGITWGASFASRGATLPTTTVLGKYQYNGFLWNSTTSTWDCVVTQNEA